MEFSAPKCSHLAIGARHQRSYSINGATISATELQRDLGVMVPSDLRFSEHADMCAKKGLQRVGILLRKFDQLPTRALLDLYKSTVRPVLEYASEVWNVQQAGDVARLEKVQRTFTRRILKQPPRWLPATTTGNGHDVLSYDQRLQRLGLESLETRRQRKDLVMVYKVVNRLNALDFGRFFQMAPVPQVGLRSVASRHSIHLAPPGIVRTLARRHAFAVRTVGTWNRLPPMCVTATTAKHFRLLLNRMSS